MSLGSNRYYITLCLHFNLFQKSFGKHLNSQSINIYLARKKVIFIAMGLFCRKYVQEMTLTDRRWTDMNMDLVVNKFPHLFKSSIRRCSVQKRVLKNFENTYSEEHLQTSASIFWFLFSSAVIKWQKSFQLSIYV